jgi:hypothetical protein
MDAQILTKIQELIQQGEKLVPEGGLEFSGYNAKMQSQYLTWRKNCLDVISKFGDKGTPLRERITKDENGAYFYQSSAHTVLESLKQTLPFAEAEAKKNPSAPLIPTKVVGQNLKPSFTAQPKPEPKVEVVTPPQQPAPIQSTPPMPVPPKPAPAPVAPVIHAPKQPAQPIAPKASAASKSVLVLSSSESELQNQLNSLLKEIGIDAVLFQRGSAVDAIVSFLDKNPESRFAFYLFTAEDVNSAMFELGYLVGKVGANRVCCIHHQNDAPPKGIPGITYREIVVKLEEISFGLIRDLKAAGYTVSI